MNRITPELADEAFNMLSRTRDLATGSMTKEMASAIEAQRTGQWPDDAPNWLMVAAAESAMPDGSRCWPVVRAHLANRTMARLAYAVHPETSQALKEATGGATCHALAGALGIDLYEYAAEAWKSVHAGTAAWASTLSEQRHV